MSDTSRISTDFYGLPIIGRDANTGALLRPVNQVDWERAVKVVLCVYDKLDDRSLPERYAKFTETQRAIILLADPDYLQLVEKWDKVDRQIGRALKKLVEKLEAFYGT